MSDMHSVIEPRSDQLNSDSLMTGPLTIRISRVTVSPGTEQPVTIFYDGDEGHPWKPCKSMARILVAAWGPDSSKYAGKSATLYRDPTVKWGGLDVGGIRVSHLSHIDRDMTLALTATRAQRKPFTVRPLKVAEPTRAETPADVTTWVASARARIAAAQTPDDLPSLTAWWNSPDTRKARERAHKEDAATAERVKAECVEAVRRLEGMEAS